MIISETIFIDHQPVGVLFQDKNSGQIDFSPIDGKTPLPDRPWNSVDELKAAVVATYSKPVNDEGPSE